jgi:hypothetical protein
MKATRQTAKCRTTGSYQRTWHGSASPIRGFIGHRKRLNIQHHEDVAWNAKDFVKCLVKPLYGREAVDALDAGQIEASAAVARGVPSRQIRDVAVRKLVTMRARH